MLMLGLVDNATQPNANTRDDRGTYVLVLRPLSGFGAPAIRRLARILKALKRGYGFQCIDVRERTEAESTF